MNQKRQRWRVALGLMIGVFLLTGSFVTMVSASSARFQETFSNLTSTPAAQYYNLRASPSTVGEWVNTGGNVQVELQNIYAVGGVTYQVQNARQVTASVFTYAGTQVSRATTGEYALGVQRFEQPFSGAMAQGRFSPGTGRVYTTQGGQHYMAGFDFDHFVFQPVDTLPADTIPYGLQITASSDGTTYRNLPLFHQGGQAKEGSSMVYETFGANIPNDTRYLRVEINQLTHIHDVSGAQTNMLTNRSTRLSGVTLTGAGLIIGVPEPIQPEPELTTPPVVSQPESGASSTEKKEKTPVKKETTKKSSTRAATDTGTKGAGTTGSGTSPQEPPPSTAKFQGEMILDSPKTTSKTTKGTTGGSSQRKTSGQNEAVSSKVEPSVGSDEMPEHQEEGGGTSQGTQAPIVYQVGENTKAKDSFSTGVMVYIVLACGLVLFLLLRPKGED